MDIYKGEQFFLSFDIQLGSGSATPENVDAVRIKVGARTQSWPGGGLQYDDVGKSWLYFLSENQTLSMPVGEVPAQIAVKKGISILKSSVNLIRVDDSIIGRWAENE